MGSVTYTAPEVKWDPLSGIHNPAVPRDHLVALPLSKVMWRSVRYSFTTRNPLRIVILGTSPGRDAILGTPIRIVNRLATRGDSIYRVRGEG